MKEKNLYQAPQSELISLRSENLFCTSWTGAEATYTGTVNAIADIEEVDISGLWN